MVIKDKTFMNKASQITSFKKKWATLDPKEMEIQWKSIHWKTIERQVNKLQSRITQATIMSPTITEQLVNELPERSAVKVARSVLRGGWQSNLSSLPDDWEPRVLYSWRRIFWNFFV
jgi:hypothetical protein